MSLDNVLDYFRTYDKSAYAVFACQGYEPSDADVADFERNIGFRFPEEFREFTKSPLGGLYMEVREELWPRPKRFHVGPFWSFLYGLMVYGISAKIPMWLDIREQYKEFKDSGYSELVPFMQIVSDADCFCFDRQGQIFKWNHDEPDQPLPVDLSFTDLLMREIRDLEIRKAQKLRGEDRPRV